MNLTLKTKSVTIKQIDHAATGRRMLRWRKKLGIRLKEAAGILGFTPPFLSDMEHGRRSWKPEYHAKLVAFYGQKEGK